ncbi:disease resistance protein RUN1-like [Cryptomeria japonica]|uniref:disease resistance protein RUN1-like n=1 Tax=Cryptomeria japonica TaxID=3369 RepID=UPI0027DA5856|nr:disease resistance protein RUN1-like [Cryptomeria japonica]
MVANDLIKTFDRVQLEVAKHPVGMDSVKNALIQKLNLNSVKEVIKVGIWATGGIGKTTFAKAVYNQIYTDFEAASFLFNVGTAAKESRGLTNLQKKILKDLSKYGGEVDSIDEGISLFRYHLRGKSVLLILDDVDAVVQLNALLGDWLGCDSRVIITSRDKHILNVAQISYECIHKVSGLEINESIQLFNRHASPSPEYEELSKRIVEACKGHPLSLEVVGSFLSDKHNDKNCWTEALHNIPLNPEIHERLYRSYSALSDEEKEIYLDIACFFIGEEKTLPIVFWKSLYQMVDTAVSNLSMKLLINIDDKGLFDMHDHVGDMGRSIAEKEKKGARIWEDACLSSISNSTNFSRLRLNGGNLQRLEMLYRPSLSYLHLENVHVEGMTMDTLATLPPSLRWLRLEKCHFAFGINSRYSGLVNNIWLSLQKCQFAFGMDSARRKPRYSRFVDNMKLKAMQIHACEGIDSVSISSLFSLANIQLQHLELDLESYSGLNNLPDTIGILSQLQHLDLRGYVRLNNLPDVIGNISQLKYLDLGLCGQIKNLIDTIGNLSALELGMHWQTIPAAALELELGRVYALELGRLQYLNIKRCESLNKLPNSITNLSQLQYFNLKGCVRLDNLHNIGNLSQLTQLQDIGFDFLSCKGLVGGYGGIPGFNARERADIEEGGENQNLGFTVSVTLNTADN